MNSYFYTAVFLIFLSFLILLIVYFVLKKNRNKIKESSKDIIKRISIASSFTLLFTSFFLFGIGLNDSVIVYFYGGLSAIFLLWIVANYFLLDYKKTNFENFFMIFGFIFSLGIIVYLLLQIKNENLQNILISFISAAIGGLMTLLGVVLTINKADKDRKNEEIKKAKPYLSISYIGGYISNSICFKDENELNSKEDFFVQFQNSNLSLIKPKKIYVNNTEKIFTIKIDVLPESNFLIRFKKDYLDLPIILELQDVYNNSFYFLIKITINKPTHNYFLEEFYEITKGQLNNYLKEETSYGK